MTFIRGIMALFLAFPVAIIQGWLLKRSQLGLLTVNYRNGTHFYLQ